MEFLRKANDEVLGIFEEIIRQYNFNYKRITSTQSAIYKDDFAIILTPERGYSNIEYLKKEGDKIFCYWIQPFMCENLTDEDRSNKRADDDLHTKIVNYLIIYEKVLRTKRESMLLGKMDWVDDFKKSKMWSIREIYPNQYSKYGELFA